MERQYQIAAIALFILVLFGVPACFIVQKDVEFSEKENRYLATKPSVSAEGVRSGEFMEDTEAYINDQFPWKEALISLKSDFLRMVGNQEINGVYLAKDGYLIEKWLPAEYDERQLMDNLEAVNKFAKEHSGQKCSVMLVPTAGMILKDKLPKNAPMFGQQAVCDLAAETLEDLSYIDLNPLFAAHCTEELYYRTDHHWTAYGAFLAYSAWCEAQGENVRAEDFWVETVAEDFQGSLYSKVLGSRCAEDRIDLCHRKKETPYHVEYNFGKSGSDSLYDMDKLSQKDKYQVFFGGNHPEVTIETSRKNGKRLLVIKDSFANSFVPFLTEDYEAIHMIDLRYFKRDIETYLRDNEITECLFLYHMKNFCEDKNIRNLTG